MTIVTSVYPSSLLIEVNIFYVFLSDLFAPFLLYIFFRLDRCEGCAEALLTNDEEAWSCPRCGRSTPIPSTVGSSFTIKESPYTLYQFDDQGATSTNVKDNPSLDQLN